jgi:fumarate reductase flavoprotein subunit
MGGVRTDKNGYAYGLKGLFSAGESACWDMHGFNRLGGNSLAETIVAGRHIGCQMVEYLKGAEATLRTDLARQAVARDTERIARIVRGADGKENVYDIRNAMQQVMMDGVGIFRNATDLQKAVDDLRVIYARSKKVGLKSSGIGASPELAMAIKISGMVRLAICVAYAALQPTESRGAHAREDFPARNDRDWLTRTLAYWRDDQADLPTLEYEPATPVFHLPPGDRGYGKCEIICREDMSE